MASLSTSVWTKTPRHAEGRPSRTQHAGQGLDCRRRTPAIVATPNGTIIQPAIRNTVAQNANVIGTEPIFIHSIGIGASAGLQPSPIGTSTGKNRLKATPTPSIQTSWRAKSSKPDFGITAPGRLKTDAEIRSKARAKPKRRTGRTPNPRRQYAESRIAGHHLWRKSAQYNCSARLRRLTYTSAALASSPLPLSERSS